MGEAPAPWDGGYLDRCFARHRVCISFGLWICSSCCWLATHALLLYLRCAQSPRRAGRGRSALGAVCFLLASLCDPAGAILAKQLPIQVFTGAYLAAIRLVSVMFVLFRTCGSESTSSSGGGSPERRRGQRLQTSAFALVLPLSLGPGWALWTAAPTASAPIRGPQRRLLGNLLQDHTETVGYLLGSVATLGSWASRMPPLSRICRGETPLSLRLWACLLSALASLLYASSILAHDRRPDPLLRATPWLLAALGRAALDLSIILLSCCVRCGLRGAWVSEGHESPDTQALLTDEGETPNPDWVPLTTLPHCQSLQTMAAVSHYMELTVEPVQRVGRGATQLPSEGQTRPRPVSPHEPPSYPPVQVIRAHVSSSSGSEASSINSDLEWDPEDTNLRRGRGGDMEMLGVQVLGGSRRPVDLTSDE
ncbi:transmembrane protein 44 isoform X2 [Sorex fumeus]|uniref:transmembrane protein 44 isoform X2 n=1 Tax=Sorex fumeus TaxID=62283 RepID=UPI0024AD1452|nr:transmembrane protein 44 isoform X2 [Sorex fumeus]